MSAAPGDRGGSRGGEDGRSCTPTPLVSHTCSIYINTHKPPSPSLFSLCFAFVCFVVVVGYSPESWLDEFSSGIVLVLMISNDVTVQ